MTPKTRVRGATIVLATLVTLCGCSHQLEQQENAEEEMTTLAEANRMSLEFEDRIAGLVPPDYVAKREQLQEAPLLSCTGENSFLWTGLTTIHLQGKPDVNSLVRTFEEHWASDEGYTMTTSTTSDGEPRVTIETPSGANFFVEFWYGDTQIHISSFSACFPLPEGNNGGDY